MRLKNFLFSNRSNVYLHTFSCLLTAWSASTDNSHWRIFCTKSCQYQLVRVRQSMCFYQFLEVTQLRKCLNVNYLCQTLSAFPEFSELRRCTELMTFGTIKALRFWEDVEFLIVWLRIATGLRSGALSALLRFSNFLQRLLTDAPSTVSLKETFLDTLSDIFCFKM